MVVKLDIKDISFSYGSKQVLNGVALEVGRGEVVSIVGPNGSGKSTLLKCIERILKPKTGAVYLDGKETATMSARELARAMGYVPQATAEVFPQTVFETVLMGRKPHLTWGVSKRDLEVVGEVLQYMGLAELAQRYLDELSGGQKQKVLIARVLAQEPEVFLFDEPTNNLDIKHQLEVLEIIKDLSKQRKSTVIMVIHDLNLASRFSDRLVLLKDGRVFAVGEPESVLTPENINLIYEVEVSVTNTSFGPNIIPIRPTNGQSECLKIAIS